MRTELADNLSKSLARLDGRAPVRIPRIARHQRLLGPGDVAHHVAQEKDAAALPPAAQHLSNGRDLGRLDRISHPVPGNHEYITSAESVGAAGYFGYFRTRAGDVRRGWRSFDLGGWHLIALNGQCPPAGGCGPGSPQERWLRADLAAHAKDRCVLAYWHEPRFSSGRHGNDKRFAAFWDDLYRAGAEVVLNGHDHDYERFAPQAPDGRADPAGGIREFVVGTGGANLRQFRAVEPNSEVRASGSAGVLVLELRQNGYTWRFAPAAGGSFSDSGSGTCH